MLLEGTGSRRRTYYNSSMLLRNNWTYRRYCSVSPLFLPHSSLDLLLAKLEDWYSVRMVDLARYGLNARVLPRSRLIDLLREKYPNHDWDDMLVLRGKYAQQKRLERALSMLFKVTDSMSQQNH